MAHFVAGDIGSKIVVSCRRRNGNIFNLSGWVPWIKYRIGGQTWERQMNITDESIGECDYNFAATELVEGIMYVEIELRQAVGTQKLSSTEIHQFNVRGKVA